MGKYIKILWCYLLYWWGNWRSKVKWLLWDLQQAYPKWWRKQRIWKDPEQNRNGMNHVKRKPTDMSTTINDVHYKLALTKSIDNDWTAKAFAICLYGGWTPCCYSCRPSAIPERVQGGGRHSVLQGIWWDRSLDSWMLLGTDFMISILAFPNISLDMKH